MALRVRTRLATEKGNLTAKTRQVIAAARAASATFQNPLFADMYVHAIAEQAVNGNGAFLRFLKHLREPPVSIETFLDSEDFMGSTDLKLWPEVRKAIVEINRFWWKGVQGGAYDQAVLAGATASGKTEIAKCTIAYHLHILGCMNSPQKYWNLPEATSIVFLIQAAKPNVTKNVVYLPLRQYIATMPWFRRHMRFDRLIEAEMLFPQHNVRISQGGSDTDAMLGEAVIGGLTDEINFMNVVQRSKRAALGTGREGSYDQAQAVFDTVTRRKEGRFMSSGPSVGVLVFASSTRYKGDFTDRRIEQIRTRRIRGSYIYNKARYEARPWEGVYCGEVFRLQVANNAAMDIRVLGDTEKAAPGGEILEIPIEHREVFLSDPHGALRDIVGRSMGAINPFIRQQTKVLACVQAGTDSGLTSFLHKDNIVLAYEGLPLPIKGHRCPSPSKPRYVHVDLSRNGDRCAVAMLRCDGIEYKDRATGDAEPLPVVSVEMCVTFEPDHANEIDIAEVRSWIKLLKTHYGYPIKAVTYDGFDCISVDTDVWTGSGLLRAGDVRVGTIVQTRSGPRAVEKVWNYGVRPTITVTTKHGHSITMTRGHKIEALNRWVYAHGKRLPVWGWVRADSLAEGAIVRIWDERSEVNADYVRLHTVAMGFNCRKTFSMPLVMTEDVALAVGLLHGNGHFGKRQVELTCLNTEAGDALRILNDAFGFENNLTWCRRGTNIFGSIQMWNQQFVDWLRHNGLSNKYTVPDSIRRSPASVQAAFICGLMSADGHIKVRDGQPSVCTTSEDYRDYLVHTLTMVFGFGVNVATVPGGYKTVRGHPVIAKATYHVSIRGSRKAFLSTIGVAYASKRDALAAFSDVQGRKIFARVASIKESAAEVVDFQVQEDHSYLANGFVSHNSQESRQAWHKAGMPTGCVPVDRSSRYYKQLRDALYDTRLLMFEQPVLLEELFALEYDEKKDKVDHPVGGGKDAADAVCGAYETVISRMSSWSMPYGDGSSRRDYERQDYDDLRAD